MIEGIQEKIEVIEKELGFWFQASIFWSQAFILIFEEYFRNGYNFYCHYEINNIDRDTCR